VIAATSKARAMLSKADEINFLSGPGRGVILIKVAADDKVIGAIVSIGRSRSADCRDHAWRRADDQHDEVRGHRPRLARARS
jgi:hypothetical protein